MNDYLKLFLPAYSLTLIAVPVALMIDHLGRGATVLRALTALPIWVISAAMFALPFALVGSGLGLLIQRVGEQRWQSSLGRLLFPLICAGLGAAVVYPLFNSQAVIAAVAGGTAAWVANTPAWPERWRNALVVLMGLASGLLLGVQYY